MNARVLRGSGDEDKGDLIPLLYVIWCICGVVGLTSVVLSLVMIRRRTPAAATPSAPVPLSDRLSELPRSHAEKEA